jgi:hypothetical protein
METVEVEPAQRKVGGWRMVRGSSSAPSPKCVSCNEGAGWRTTQLPDERSTSPTDRSVSNDAWDADEDDDDDEDDFEVREICTRGGCAKSSVPKR